MKGNVVSQPFLIYSTLSAIGFSSTLKQRPCTTKKINNNNNKLTSHFNRESEDFHKQSRARERQWHDLTEQAKRMLLWEFNHATWKKMLPLNCWPFTVLDSPVKGVVQLPSKPIKSTVGGGCLQTCDRQRAVWCSLPIVSITGILLDFMKTSLYWQKKQVLFYM